MDTRVWIGRVRSDSMAEHEQFIAWLGTDEAREVYRRRRLVEYALYERNGQLSVIFRAPHTGDPRIMIDFLRYPGMWPQFWEFERAGGAAEAELVEADGSAARVSWRRPLEES